MIVQMLIAERRDRYALAECLETYTEKIGPLLAKAQGLHAAYLAGEEGESLLAIVYPHVDIPRSSRGLAERRRL